MTDFATDMAAMRARANELLGRTSNPLMDVGMAALQSYGNPAQSFNSNLRNIEATRAREVLGAASILRGLSAMENQQALMQNRGRTADRADFAQNLAAMRVQNQQRNTDLRERNTDSLVDTRQGNLANRQRQTDIRELDALARSGHRDAKATADAIRLFAGDDPANRSALFAAMDEDEEPVSAANAYDIAARHAQNLGIAKPARAPQTRRVMEGDEIITQQFDNGAWSEVARAPRSTARPQGPTIAQEANNAEVDAARQQLMSMNLSPSELRRRQDPAERGYDPMLGRLVRIATQRKRGDDKGFGDIWGRVYGTTPPSDPTPVPPAPSPSLATVPGDADEVLPMDANGGIEAMKLVPGRVYTTKDKSGQVLRLKWTGEDFEGL
jgi:TolA-binding protein